VIVSIGAHLASQPSTWQGAGICLYQLSSFLMTPVGTLLLIPNFFFVLAIALKPAFEKCEAFDLFAPRATGVD
jgi:hypothetical protein